MFCSELYRVLQSSVIELEALLVLASEIRNMASYTAFLAEEYVYHARSRVRASVPAIKGAISFARRLRIDGSP